MDRIEAVVPFAPAPHLLPSELRELVTQVDRGPHGTTWRARDEVAADPDRRARWDQARRRFEKVFPLGERWQVAQVLAVAGGDSRLVHLHDLADDLAEGTHAAGTVLADVPSAVAAETTEMVAALAGLLEQHPARGCLIHDEDGRPVWSGAALTGPTGLRGADGLVLHTDGQLELVGAGPVHGWQVADDAVTAMVTDPVGGVGRVELDDGRAGWLASLAPSGATRLSTCPAMQACAQVVTGLADGLSTSVQFQRSLLLELPR